ncbi:MAG: hypothetical protein AMK72_09970 [Planctomycetes bacterium SM23_25]|nr:MAG: hypothetical protein AMK72_09970 [Planctomycetes bacterium SM23_25]
MVFVVPSFSTLFATLDVPLPASTKIMINISKFVVSYWYILVGLLVTGIFGIRLWLQSAHGKRTIDSMVLRLPVVGRIMRGFLTARIARTLGILLEARVPITDALPLAREGAGNVHYAELLSRAKDAVISGKSISDGLSGSDLVNPCICEAVRNGERSGVVGRVLLEIADFMDEENQTLLRSLTSLLEPVILVILGLLVGLVAVSLFLPLFDITAMTQGSGP